MRIKEILNQYRRDFTAVYECEHCHHTITSSGYDDAYFHANVVPSIICTACGKKAEANYRPLTTKYDEGEQV